MTDSPKSSRALYADIEGNVVVQEFPLPKPRDDELLIQVLYSGVNPSDFETLKFFNCRNRVLGNEFCGKVLDSPALERLPFWPDTELIRNASRFRRPGFTKFPTSPPPNAATLTIVTQTANDTLFNRFGLPTPYEVTGPTEGTLVIWGAATSVGMAAVQLARASRVSVIIATASPKRHDFLKTLGATHCFDYNDAHVGDKIKAVIDGAGGGPIWEFNAVGTVDSPTPRLFSSGLFLRATGSG
ncbi:Zinc-type alcohol dehydrogenase-like protein C2E1P3.01-like protein 5 [Colletotrichum sojae]|uniref:Zinc-type alcohol dehydrogenase-like protein C2E1P3.01-like protein 5 n=1 Tax=Colletotrichum sojae TaxID=2175907 RepID=A0A8H6J191_9PEZI|nr:Zinc-type alcohol dehydrogenase-like protein C2E1P3.01-like protein 5 [Colletotrichum sojae]